MPLSRFPPEWSRRLEERKNRESSSSKELEMELGVEGGVRCSESETRERERFFEREAKLTIDRKCANEFVVRSR